MEEINTNEIRNKIRRLKEYYGHDGYDIDSILEELGLNERFCIENWQKIGLYKDEVFYLVKKQDADYIKEVIKNFSDYGWEEYKIVDLIVATRDNNYIHEAIEKRKEYKFANGGIVKLVESLQEPDYTKEVVEQKEEYGIKSPFDLERLIESTNDAEYIKRIISNKEFYEFSFSEIADLVIATQDNNYIKEYIDTNKNIVPTFTIANLIGSTKDIKYIKECIEKKEENGFCLSDIVKLVSATQDIEYIKQCMERYEFANKDIEKLLVVIKDKDRIRDFIYNREEYGIYNSDKVLYNPDVENYETEQNIDLPDSMTVGIEIESEGAFSNLLLALEEFENGWKCKEDYSLGQGGVEIVSPVLNNSFKSVEDINEVCRLLQDFERTVSDECAGHIHIGADYLTSVKSYKNLIEIYCNTEKVLYKIANENGESLRDEYMEYAMPLSRKMELAIDRGELDLQNEEDLPKFIDEIKSVQYIGHEQDESDENVRRKGINFLNIGGKDKNTIEFRIPNATLNPNTWIENINLFGGIVKAAQELSIIQQKSEELLTEEERKKIEALEILKTEEVSEEEILEALLTLAINEDKRSIYRKRYKNNTDRLEELESDFSDKKIIMKNDIGKLVFTGDEPVNGEEYRDGKIILEDYIKDVEKVTDMKDMQ